MPDLPTGIVTFLFTDVEGSTRLLEALGERYADLQRQHDDILRAAIADAGGCVVSTEGDACFAVFRTPAAAVTAAVRAQRELAAAPWPDGVSVRVRMGLHTGEGMLSGDSYLGMDVNRAARIAAAGHGGQVLLSDATRVLAERSLPEGTRLRDLGQHRLKDLRQPERLYQVVIDGLPEDFPPPRTLDARPNNLPAQLTSFIGRRDEIARVLQLLSQHRLVTLTGPGGTGKTRLALQVAAEALPRFRDGGFFVDLSAVTIPDLVPATIAAVVDVREEPGRSLLDTLTRYVREMELLLVLDNLEQVMDAGGAVLEPLLRAAPGLTVLATTRVPLRLYGEQEFPVPPLALPDLRHVPDLASLSRFEAVALFAQRAKAVRPDFRLDADNARAVAEITVRLDGLPLALELAASRVKLLPPRALLERLEQRLPLLAARDRNIPERQRTLRRTIEWSYDLLDEVEQRMFRRLAVFAGGAGFEAVDAVVNPDGELGADTLDTLATLVDNSLVRSLDVPEGDSRFVMLETIREYGLERLAESGEHSILQQRHAEHAAQVAEQTSEALTGPEQAARTRRLERDLDNFRTALSWALRSGQAEPGLRLATALRDFWRLAGHLGEGVRWLRELLALPAAAGSTPLRAQALIAAADLTPWIGETEAQLEFAEAAVAVYRDLDDRAGIAHALKELGWARMHAGQLESARADLEEARQFQLGQGRRETAESDLALGMLASLEGDTGRAREHLEDALEAFEALEDPFWRAFTQLLVGDVDKVEGNLDRAEERYRASLTEVHQLDVLVMTASVLYSFADLALIRGQYERALRLAGVSDALREPFGAMSPLEKASVADVRAAAAELVDEATAESLYQEGRAMGLEEALAYALRQDA